MSQVGAGRDEWMRRTGPFYPLLVAARLQSALTIAPDLEPSEDDRRRAVPYVPLVGVALGVALALIAWALRGVGMAPVAAAAVLAVLAAVAGGFRYERAAATVATALTRRVDLVVTLAATMAVALVLRAALLAGVHAGAWTAALIVSLAAGRSVLALALLLSASGDAGDSEGSWLSAGAVAAVTLIAVAFAAGFLGIAVLAATAPLGILCAARMRRGGDRRAQADGAALAAEILALLVVAAAAPAAP